MPDYEYLPLGSNEIRRLILFLGSVEDPLEVRVVHDIFEPPHTVPQYEALWYVWGSQETPEILTVFGDTVFDGSLDRSSLREAGSIPLGQNLATALRHLRRKSEGRVIWCDAVCINQRDASERSVQVQRMKDVYRVSERVVAWLSQGSEETQRAVKVLCQEMWTTAFDYNANKWLNDKESLIKRSEYFESLDQQDWRAIHYFLSLPWFKRLWVRQEIVLANDSAIFMIGAAVVDLATFINAIDSIYWYAWKKQLLIEDDAQIDLADKITNVWSLLHSRQNLASPIDYMLGWTQTCECSDPRDRIYGILGICEKLDICPDYTKSAQDVYLDVVRIHVDRYKTANFLG
ncbi:ankyrin and het domain protein [Colletotrichum sojae]|uniref:Ankyrin and het domain protein n=1 Tax=Colletotrichum sojae TaxID=2175907 RepID=A0A8H6N2W2_9PEZI|nr:ankyrin and het domain protein [Colletotrichum sojae]